MKRTGKHRKITDEERAAQGRRFAKGLLEDQGKTLEPAGPGKPRWWRKNKRTELRLVHGGKA